MTQEYYSIITNAGLAKHAAASLGGLPINLTHLAVGDSNGTPYNPVASATALQNERHRTTTTYVVVDEDNPNQIIVEAIIDETVGPFYLREVGIFDSDGDLFAIGKFPETFKPNLPTGSGKRLYVRMILGFASTPQVSLVVSSQAINNDPNFSTTVFNALAQKLAKAQNLADLEDDAEARVNLGLEIGVNVQAFAENLVALAALVGAINKVPYFTGAGVLAMADLFSNRNAIINGNFNIWQRGTSFPNMSKTNAGYTVDRWRYDNQNSLAVHTLSQSSDVPTVAQAGRLFNYSLLINCTTADSSVEANDFVSVIQPIEGYNFLPLAQKPTTLSFWVKATKTGTYCTYIVNSVGDKSFVAEYTINTSDVWEFKTINIPASPSAGTWNYANGVGAFIGFPLMVGSLRQGVLGWQAGDIEATSNVVNACDSSANNFRICGVQLESGSVATPFEYRSFQQELILCQRYYEKSYDFDTPPGTVSNGGSVRGFIVTNTPFRQNIFFKTTKRISPTLTYYNPATGTIGQISFGWGGSSTTSVVYEEASTTKWTGGSNATQATYPDAYFHWTANSEL